jgi:hypothetical protein
MAKKKGGKKGKKGGKDVKVAIVVETTKEMERERALVKTMGVPLGARYSTKRRADAIRAEVRIKRGVVIASVARSPAPAAPPPCFTPASLSLPPSPS